MAEFSYTLTEDTAITLWVGAFRYALGRMTYISGMTAGDLIKHWHEVPQKARDIIKRDLDSAIEHDARDRKEGRSYCALGMDCDRDEWLKLHRFIEASISKESKHVNDLRRR